MVWKCWKRSRAWSRCSPDIPSQRSEPCASACWRAGGRVLHWLPKRDSSFCCCGGGGLAFLGEETGERVSHNRAQELVATGANIVGTACPFCNTMFRDALASGAGSPPKLLDIAQIAAATLPP